MSSLRKFLSVKLRRVFTLLACLLLTAGSLHAHSSAAEMAVATKSLLKVLTPAQQNLALQSFDDKGRTHWLYVPSVRQGLPLKQLSDKQRPFIQNLLKTALSQSGYLKAESIRELENILKVIEAGQGKSPRDTEMYYLTIFGVPGDKGTWAWRWEGHHLSLNFTIINGDIVSASPLFMGNNPGQVSPEQANVSQLKMLNQEDSIGLELIQSLTVEQRKVAIIAEKAPADITTKNQEKLEPATNHQGIALSDLSAEQKFKIGRIIAEYVGRTREEFALGEMIEITATPENKIFFAWAGGMVAGEGHYYRIEGPSFLFELDNTQNNANHVHTVWRDRRKDFGYDALTEHLKRVHAK
jgi:hypothetical protein